MRFPTQTTPGERERFETLARDSQDRLYRLALANGLGTTDAADVVQDALTRAWENRSRFRPDGDLAAWVAGIAINCIRERREGSGERNEERDRATPNQGRSEPSAPECCASPRPRATRRRAGPAWR